MKSIIYKLITLLFLCIISFGCSEDGLDLNPLSEGSSEGWYSNDTEIRMSLDYLYTIRFWNPNPDPLYFYHHGFLDGFTDNQANRNILTPVIGGTMNSETSFMVSWWGYYYKAIAAANLLLEKIEDNAEISETNYLQYSAEARFARAAMYSKLIFYWGDVPYFEETLSIEEAFAIGRTDKDTILQHIYDDFDYASSNLPEAYSGTKYATKGAALALKARIALYMDDWAVARDAAKSCIDLGVYDLYSDFEELFLTKTKNTEEAIFSIPRSEELSSTILSYSIKRITPRTSGGSMFIYPTWDLFCSFLCTDGLPIDESPLYNPQKPFENRDPRCTATIVEFGTEFGGIIYQPHPDSLVTTNYIDGTRVTNNDCLSNTQWASWTGLAWKKGYDEDWFDDFIAAPEHWVIRYDDVLLIYAEAEIELNEIDQSVLDAMNKVRARAYGAGLSETSLYPAITTMEQDKLRQILRIERRMEFAFEGTRYEDIIRWGLAEKVLNLPIYGLLSATELKELIVEPGLWFFPETPPIDEDGQADFTSMYGKGYCKIIAQRSFNESKNYLWPIPASEIQINENLTQNPGY